MLPDPHVPSRDDLLAYAEFCDRVQVVRGLQGLEQVTTSMAVPT